MVQWGGACDVASALLLRATSQGALPSVWTLSLKARSRLLLHRRGHICDDGETIVGAVGSACDVG